MLKKAALFILYLFLSSSLLFADNWSSVLPYDKALEVFRKNSSDLKIAKINKGITKRDGSVASSWIPSINISSTLLTGSGGFFPDKKDWTWDKDPEVGVTASLTLSAANFANIVTDVVNAAVADFTYKQTKNALEQAFFSLYWGYAAAEKALSAGSFAREQAQLTFNESEAKYNAGLISSLDYMNAKVAFTDAEKSYWSFKETRDTAYYSLKDMLKLKDDFSAEELDEPVFVNLPSADELFSKYFSTNTTLKQLNLTHKALKAGYNSAALGYRLPSVNFAFNYRYGKDISAVPTAGIKGDDIMTFGITAALPVDGFIPGTKAFTTIADLKDNAKIAEIRKKDGVLSYRQEIESNINKINSLEAAYISSIQQAQFAMESFKLTRDAYNAGSVPMSTFASAMSGYLMAEVAAVSANMNYRSAVYSFAEYLGVDEEDFINEYKKK